MRRPATLILALLLVLLPSTSASAQTVEGRFCAAFPVRADILENRTADRPAEGLRPFRLINTGRLVVRVTNQTNGKSVVLNVSGPTFATPNPDGTTTLDYRGRALIGMVAGEPGGPRLFVNSGQVVLVLDPAGVLTQVRQTGHLEDLCVTLAT